MKINKSKDDEEEKEHRIKWNKTIKYHNLDIWYAIFEKEFSAACTVCGIDWNAGIIRVSCLFDWLYL